jgi:NADH-quinone oxidoreductase subunit N
LVIVAVINSAVAIYYYLRIVRAAFFGEKSADIASEPTPIVLKFSTVSLCALLLVGITALGVAPASVLNTITGSLATLRFLP